MTGAKIEANAITGVHIAFDAIGAFDIAPDAVGGSEIASSAVTSSEIADGSVNRADIGGTEVPLYQNISECGSTVLTLAATCFTTVCSPGPPQVFFYQCNGACTATGPQQCNTTLRGYLLGTAIP